MAKLRPITKREWAEYDWIRVGETEFVRGVKYTCWPDDGYEYVEVTTISDKEQRWARAMTSSEE